MSVDNILIPYCIYHSIDTDTKTCLGLLSPPEKTIDKDGNHVFKCARNPSIINRWTHHGTFYGIRPTLRPIPTGMDLVCATKANYYPYDTTTIDNTIDPYTLHSACVYFITYTEPCPGTVPLYLHYQGNHSFPSFDPEPPYASEQQWKIGGSSSNIDGVAVNRLPVCYVMTEQTVGKLVPFRIPPGGKGANITFTCLNGRCVPTKGIPIDAFNNTIGDEMDIETCLMKCNVVVQTVNNRNTDTSLIDSVQKLTSKNAIIPLVTASFAGTSKIVPVIVVSIFVFCLFLVIYFTWIRRKNKNGKSVRKAHYW